MKPVWWMAGAGVMSWLAATWLVGMPAGVDVAFGMAGPLAAAIATWALVERTHRGNPERLTALMVTMFAGKIVFFGAYVTFMLKVLSLRPVPFVASFTSCFIALHLMEALYLRRLFAGERP